MEINVAELTPKCLKDKYDIEQADVMVFYQLEA